MSIENEKVIELLTKKESFMSKVVGYMRVSTHHQKFDSQKKALNTYGVDMIFKEYESGTKTERSQLNKALSLLEPGDTFVIFKLDRLARSTKQLLLIMEEFEAKSIQFVSIQNQIDTSTPMGRFFFTVMGAFAEMEAALIRERVIAGIEAARDKGTPLGRPTSEKQVAQALVLYQNTSLPIKEIAGKCGVSPATIYNYAKKQNISRKKKT